MRRGTSWRVLLAAFFLLVLAVSAAQAAIDPTTAQKLLAGDGAAADSFGWSVAVDGGTALIGAVSDSGSAHVFDDESRGAAYVFVRADDGTWSQQAKLTAADGAAYDSFGYSVSVDGGTAVIGTHGDDDKGDWSGSAYVFVRADDGTWSQQAKLTAADGAAYDFFGGSVSVSGSTALISASGDDQSRGSAYVFVRADDGTWSQQAKLTAADGAADDWFGYSVSVSGGTALIGAMGDDDQSRGSAYVFIRAADGTWSQQAKLTAADRAAYDYFGYSVSLSADGNTAVIGAYYKDDKGAAYVFVRTADGTWSRQAKLTAADRAAYDYFGYSVSLSADGNTAVIGAYYKDDKGAAYVFVRAANRTWSQQVKLTTVDGAEGDRFGYSVSVSGGTAVIGAQGDDDRGTDAGAAYVFGSAVTPQGAAQSAINSFLLSK